MNRTMMSFPKCFCIVLAAACSASPGFSGAEASEVLSQRNKSLRQQYDRVDTLLLETRNNNALPSLRVSHPVNGMMAFNAVSGPGAISLSQDAVINQQLNQGMADARLGLIAIKEAQESDVIVQDSQRNTISAALDQAVQAYLMCRVEAKVPINSHYEQDSFLKEMIVISELLTQKELSATAINNMLERLVAARTTLVALTELRK